MMIFCDLSTQSIHQPRKVSSSQGDGTGSDTGSVSNEVASYPLNFFANGGKDTVQSSVRESYSRSHPFLHM